MVNGGEKAGSTDLAFGINEMVGKKKKWEKGTADGIVRRIEGGGQKWSRSQGVERGSSGYAHATSGAAMYLFEVRTTILRPSTRYPSNTSMTRATKAWGNCRMANPSPRSKTRVRL